MRQWVDVNPGSWYYNEVIEATNYRLPDGSYFISGIPYNVFEDSAQRTFVEITAGEGQKEFNLGQNITVSSKNPLYVYVDGVQVIYKGVKDSDGNYGSTGDIVELYTGVRAGQIVTFIQGGIPALSSGVGHLEGRPYLNGDAQYPCKPMSNGDTYYFSTSYMPYYEYCYAYGMPLKRAIIPIDEWRDVDSSSRLQALLRRYIGYERDVYTISPNNPDDFPYAVNLASIAYGYGEPYTDLKPRSWIFLPYNLNNVTCYIMYVSRDSVTGNFVLSKGNFQASSLSGKVEYNDRFFPNTYVTRGEAIVFMNRLRESFYARFTDNYKDFKLYNSDGEIDEVKVQEVFIVDEGQTVLDLPESFYDNGVKVIYNGEELDSSDYKVYSSWIKLKKHVHKNGIILVSWYTDESARFTDIEGWYKWDIIAIENEKFQDGSFLLEGDGRLYPDEPLKRYEIVVMLNRFRKWCIEKFKL